MHLSTNHLILQFPLSIQMISDAFGDLKINMSSWLLPLEIQMQEV